MVDAVSCCVHALSLSSIFSAYQVFCEAATWLVILFGAEWLWSESFFLLWFRFCLSLAASARSLTGGRTTHARGCLVVSLLFLILVHLPPSTCGGGVPSCGRPFDRSYIIPRLDPRDAFVADTNGRQTPSPHGLHSLPTHTLYHVSRHWIVVGAGGTCSCVSDAGVRVATGALCFHG